MKEITRIHLAKVAYDIELDAKKELEHYVEALAKHTDPEVMTDIESRMVELLAERGVVAGGVIVRADVDDMRAQLGQPKDFAAVNDDEPASGITANDDEKRLYRDMDNAVLGGVLSGIAAYLKVDPVVVRVVFVVLVLITHGAAIILYLLMWFIVPPARTAGQKLQMQGKPITAASIREFSEREFTNERLAVLRKTLYICIGIFAVFCMGMALIVTAVMGLRLYNGLGWESIPGIGVTVAGLLATFFFGLLAHTFFAQEFTAKRGNDLAMIAVAGVISFAVFVAATIAWGGSSILMTIPGLQ